MDVGALLSGLVACDPAAADRGELERCVRASARVRAWLDHFDVGAARALDEKTGYGQKVFADATNVSMHAAEKVLERGRTLALLPRLDAAMQEGDVSGAHIDGAARGLRYVGQARRDELAAIVDRLVPEATALPAHEFEDRVKREAHRLLERDGVSKHEQQKRDIRFRSWLRRGTGMWCGNVEVDPLTGVILDKRIQDEVDRLFADGVPDGCPTDPIEKQQHLGGLAVISLLMGEGGGSGRPELVVVVDATQVDDEGRPTVDWGLPVDLPPEALRAVAARARLHVVALWPSSELFLGRSQRLASAAQRRVLRALYSTCAMPGCEARFSKTKAHHVWWWEHGGPTDIDNLLPLCSRCHHRVHDRGWRLKLLPDRTLEVTLPDGSTLETGPPSRAP